MWVHRIATTAILLCSLFLAGSSGLAQSRVRGVSLLPLAPHWTRELPFGDSIRLVIGESRVLVATNTRIDALSWATGDPAWIAEMAATVPPLIHDSRVFVAADDQIHALTELTGRVEWRLPVGAVKVPLVYRAGWLFVVGENGKLRGVRASDGAVIWEVAASSTNWALEPVVDGDSVFGMTAEGVLTAWRVSDGTQLWQIQATPDPVAILTAHAHVYVATNGRLTSYRQTTGARRWSYEVEMPVVSRLAADLTHVYLATVDNAVRAHRASNGHLVWKRIVDARVVDGLSADGSHVLVPQSDGTVRFMLTETGVRAGQLNAPDEEARGARAIATSGYGPTLRLARMTVSDTAARRIETFMRQSRVVTAATTLTGIPVPLTPIPIVKRP
jgi:outer membrane protein assembly factor BamB